MVCTLLLKGECGDMAGGMRQESGTGVLLSDKEMREVLGRLGGGGGGLPRRSGGGDRLMVTGRKDPPPPQLGSQGQGPQGGTKGPRHQRRKW